MDLECVVVVDEWFVVVGWVNAELDFGTHSFRAVMVDEIE